jgi:hypothetical protein
MLFNKAKFVKNLGKWKMAGQPHTLPLIFKNSFFVADNFDSRWFFDFLAVFQEGNSAVVSTKTFRAQLLTNAAIFWTSSTGSFFLLLCSA